MPVVDTLRLKTKLSDIGMPELDFVQNEGHRIGPVSQDDGFHTNHLAARSAIPSSTHPSTLLMPFQSLFSAPTWRKVQFSVPLSWRSVTHASAVASGVVVRPRSGFLPILTFFIM